MGKERFESTGIVVKYKGEKVLLTTLHGISKEATSFFIFKNEYVHMQYIDRIKENQELDLLLLKISQEIPVQAMTVSLRKGLKVGAKLASFSHPKGQGYVEFKTGEVIKKYEASGKEDFWVSPNVFSGDSGARVVFCKEKGRAVLTGVITKQVVRVTLEGEVFKVRGGIVTSAVAFLNTE